MPPSAAADPAAELEGFVQQCHAAITRQSQGEPESFLDLWSRRDDVSIMAAIGGYQTGFPAINDLLVAASQTQSFDGWSAENLVTVLDGDLAITVELEHYSHANDEPGMTLRATMVYRRETEGWRVIHRHGDVLEDIAAKW